MPSTGDTTSPVKDGCRDVTGVSNAGKPLSRQSGRDGALHRRMIAGTRYAALSEAS
jgi:hypothetical protein